MMGAALGISMAPQCVAQGSSAWLGPPLAISWLHPGLAALGAGLILIPILIHLLSRRRFQTVEWAAMEFLLEADEENRRRVQLENLLLLLLRCLAVLLTGLLVARTQCNPQDSVRAASEQPVHRIVVLDDSPSMAAPAGASTSLGLAKSRLTDMASRVAASRPGDRLTLILTSQPTGPALQLESLDADNVNRLNQFLAGLDEPSAQRARFETALKTAAAVSATNMGEGESTVVHVLSDLRRRDWRQGEAPRPSAALVQLDELSQQAGRCYLIGVAGPPASNLAVVGLESRDAVLAAGAEAQFDVTVQNFGPRDMTGVVVRLAAGPSPPLTARVERLAAGKQATVPFLLQLPELTGSPAEERREPDWLDLRATASLESAGSENALAADDQRFLAAPVSAGLRVLLVDGEPSAEFGESETFYLQWALSPRGPNRSGVAAQTVTETAWQDVPLASQQIIFLCNCDLAAVKKARLEALESWVRRGGRLVIMPGSAVFAADYNRRLYRDGAGLLPLPLKEIAGHEDQDAWVHFRVTAPNHPAMKALDLGETVLDLVKVFRWWRIEEPRPHAAPTTAGGESSGEARPAASNALQREVAVLARLTDEHRSPAIVEKRFGRGRVLLLAIPADDDWTNWPRDPQAGIYVIAMLELTKYLAPSEANWPAVTVGEPLSHLVNLADFEPAAAWRLPAGGQQSADVRPANSTDSPNESGAAGETAPAGPSDALQYFELPATTQQGQHRLVLTRRGGGQYVVLAAANLDPAESDLERIDAEWLKSQWSGDQVQLASGEQDLPLGGGQEQEELWPLILLILVGVLLTEQLLAWLFGRRRS